MPDCTTRAPARFHYAFAIVASCIVLTCLPCALVLSCAGIFFNPVSAYFGVPKASFTLYFSMNLPFIDLLPAGRRFLPGAGRAGYSCT